MKSFSATNVSNGSIKGSQPVGPRLTQSHESTSIAPTSLTSGLHHFTSPPKRTLSSPNPRKPSPCRAPASANLKSQYSTGGTSLKTSSVPAHFSRRSTPPSRKCSSPTWEPATCSSIMSSPTSLATPTPLAQSASKQTKQSKTPSRTVAGPQLCTTSQLFQECGAFTKYLPCKRRHTTFGSPNTFARYKPGSQPIAHIPKKAFRSERNGNQHHAPATTPTMPSTLGSPSELDDDYFPSWQMPRAVRGRRRGSLSFASAANSSSSTRLARSNAAGYQKKIPSVSPTTTTIITEPSDEPKFTASAAPLPGHPLLRPRPSKPKAQSITTTIANKDDSPAGTRGRSTSSVAYGAHPEPSLTKEMRRCVFVADHLQLSAEIQHDSSPSRQIEEHCSSISTRPSPSPSSASDMSAHPHNDSCHCFLCKSKKTRNFAEQLLVDVLQNHMADMDLGTAEKKGRSISVSEEDKAVSSSSSDEELHRLYEEHSKRISMSNKGADGTSAALPLADSTPRLMSSGLPVEVRYALPLAIATPAETPQTCSICQSSYAVGCHVITLPCEHFFHARCVDQWLWGNDSCPLCRRPAALVDNEAPANADFIVAMAPSTSTPPEQDIISL